MAERKQATIIEFELRRVADDKVLVEMDENKVAVIASARFREFDRRLQTFQIISDHLYENPEKCESLFTDFLRDTAEAYLNDDPLLPSGVIWEICS